MMQAINTGQSGFRLTPRVRHKAGHYRWIEGTSSIVCDPDTGALVEILAVLRDISERNDSG